MKLRNFRILRRLTPLGLAFAGLLTLTTAATSGAVEAGMTVTAAVELPGNRTYPESMALDPRNGDLYVTSFGTGAVYKAAAGQSKATDFLPEGTDGRNQAMGVKVDRQGRLWVNDADGVTIYNTADKRRLARFLSPTPGRSVLNDLEITPDGTAYVTDSLRQVVYRVTPAELAGAMARGGDGGNLVTAFDLNAIVTPQPEGTIKLNGIECTATCSHLVTVDMATGELFRLEIATGTVREITVQGGSLLSGDGLLLEKNKLWVAQYGSDGVSRVVLNADVTTATVERQVTDPALRRPTAILRREGSVHVVRSQFGFDSLDLPFTVARVSGI
ncbi:SMP-30/gluconolactonase/LRE family protein [Streptomyces sp. T-3]|nr:SMP-30/gluconolactonase/LRE family protein [Streptomyces sp. T-3]